MHLHDHHVCAYTPTVLTNPEHSESVSFTPSSLGHGLYKILICMKMSNEKGPMGSAPYLGLKVGHGSTFELSILCTNKCLNSV